MKKINKRIFLGILVCAMIMIFSCNLLYADNEMYHGGSYDGYSMCARYSTGNIEGMVTELLSGILIENAFITIGNKGGYTNESGYYYIEEISCNTYDAVSCDASDQGYNIGYAYDVNICEGNTTDLNFQLTSPTMTVDPLEIIEYIYPNSTSVRTITINNDGNGELYFSCASYPSNTLLETDYSQCSKNGSFISGDNHILPPQTNSKHKTDSSKDEVILHYDGDHYDQIGLSAGGTFITAARFTEEELENYYGCYAITGIQIFIADNGFNNVTLKVWQGGSYGDPGYEIFSQDITSEVVVGDWTYYDISSSLALLTGNEYWIGYSIDHDFQSYPAGCDQGPAVPGKGDWVYSADEWNQLHIISPYDYNWNIRAVLNESSSWMNMSPYAGSVDPGGETFITLTFDATGFMPDTTLTTNIIIDSDPEVGSYIVPVELNVIEYGVEVPNNNITTHLNQCFPNPFSMKTTISFGLRTQSQVILSIYNIKGELITTLIHENRDPCKEIQLKWDGSSDGKQCRNGIYFYKLSVDDKIFIKKVVLIK